MFHKIYCENENIFAECREDGAIKIIKKSKNKKYVLHLFGEDFQYLYASWDVVPLLYLSKNGQFLIVTYGIGYVYFVSLETCEVVKQIRLFQEVSYDDESYMDLDLCCYYNERTQVTFSPTGKYMEIRVRGDYDPQSEDGRSIDEIFTPIYFRNVFLVDMETLDICFQYDYHDVEERSGRNVAVVAFSPDEKFLVVGALGNALKVFDITNKTECGTPMSVRWVPDPLGIRDCPLVKFIDNENFVYVNRNHEEKYATLQSNGIWYG